MIFENRTTINYNGIAEPTGDSILFMDSSEAKAYAAWLASPLAEYESNTYKMHVAGSYAYSGDTSINVIGCGFRPIVALPKKSL